MPWSCSPLSNHGGIEDRRHSGRSERSNPINGQTASIIYSSTGTSHDPLYDCVVWVAEESRIERNVSSRYCVPICIELVLDGPGSS